jgi:hypothetical protein
LALARTPAHCALRQFCLFDAVGGIAVACDAGPDSCTDDPRISAARAGKKQSLVNNPYPARLMGLVDIGLQYVARIDREPDGFTLIDVQSPSHTTSIGWPDDEENIAKKHLLDGSSVRYWIVNARHAFSRDGRPPFNQQRDYDATDDVNASGAIKCVLQGGATVCSR